MGQPGGSNIPSSVTECIGCGGKRGELKHLSSPRRRKKILDFPSSGERKGTSLNHVSVIALMRWTHGVVGVDLAPVRRSREVTKISLTEVGWKAPPQKVMVL